MRVFKIQIKILIPHAHLSPIEGVPKSNGTTRVILDLSSPRGYSMNDFKSKEAFSVKYSWFDDGKNGRRDAKCFYGKTRYQACFQSLRGLPSPHLFVEW